MTEPRLLEDFKPFQDARGSFQKIFRQDQLEKLGFTDHFRESFVSYSEPGVLRGMHFQLPPADHWKLVTCIAGEVLDVCVDLRAGSTYGQAHAFQLSSANGHSLLIPRGFAHGFLTRGTQAAGVLYLTTSEHAPEQDCGIRWDSFQFDWGTKSPRISDRDSRFVGLSDFRTPFGGSA